LVFSVNVTSICFEDKCVCCASVRREGERNRKGKENEREKRKKGKRERKGKEKERKKRKKGKRERKERRNKKNVKEKETVDQWIRKRNGERERGGRGR
jgi:hypothetical protein